MASRTNRGATAIETIELTRRRLLQVMGGIVSLSGAAAMAGAQPAATQQLPAVPFTPSILPAGIRSRFVNNVNGLRVHVLEAGFEARNRPAVVFLHGFPELAYSWRKVMLPIAAAGYHVIAPDLRGLRGYDRMGRRLRWRPRVLRAAQLRPGHGGTCLRTRLPIGNRTRWT